MSKQKHWQPKKPKNKGDRKKSRGNFVYRAVVMVDNDFRKVVQGLTGT